MQKLKFFHTFKCEPIISEPLGQGQIVQRSSELRAGNNALETNITNVKFWNFYRQKNGGL
jgi:hypothetical protein